MRRWSPPECGTSCCAAGHYITAFPRRALQFGGDGPDGKPPVYGAAIGFDALTCYFGMGLREAVYIFAPGDGPADRSPKAKARQIEKFIETGVVPD